MVEEEEELIDEKVLVLQNVEVTHLIDENVIRSIYCTDHDMTSTS